ncbi:hypothetical protein [Mesorhizobium sp. NZP2298]|uniref:hypothetical protein n=1 Tax=Mesorhizobium sp. NZP2298 TaxID=2483403 RepID=UPI001553B033|nr:hypothetical protein [Mesorhizobium sp. NZP2298]
MTFIADILLGMGWLEPDGFHASASEQRTGGPKPPSKKVPGVQKNLMAPMCVSRREGVRFTIA